MADQSPYQDQGKEKKWHERDYQIVHIPGIPEFCSTKDRQSDDDLAFWVYFDPDPETGECFKLALTTRQAIRLRRILGDVI